MTGEFKEEKKNAEKELSFSFDNTPSNKDVSCESSSRDDRVGSLRESDGGSTVSPSSRDNIDAARKRVYVAARLIGGFMAKKKHHDEIQTAQEPYSQRKSLRGIMSSKNRYTECTKAVDDALKILEDACAMNEPGDTDDRIYFNSKVRTFLKEMLLCIIIQKPPDMLGYVQECVSQSRFRTHYQNFFSESKMYKANAPTETGAAKEKADESADAAHGEKKSSDKFKSSSSFKTNDSTPEEIIEDIATRMEKFKKQSTTKIGNVHSDIASINFTSAFEDLGGERKMLEARENYNIESLLSNFLSTHPPKKAVVQDKEYDTLPLQYLIAEAKSKNDRYQRVVAQLAQHTGGQHMPAAVKGMEKAGLKCSLKFSNDVWRLRDVVTAQIIYDDFDPLYKAFHYLLTDETVNRYDVYPVFFEDWVVTPKPRCRGIREITGFYSVDYFICRLKLSLRPMVSVHDTCGRVAKRLLDTGSEILLLCCIKNYTQDARRLLDHDADCNRSIDAHGRTCLHYAASHNNVKLLQVLLEHGADPSRRDEDGAMPFFRALQKGYLSITVLLLGQLKGCFETLESQAQTKCRLSLSFWLDKVRYDQVFRTGGKRVLKHLAALGGMYDLLATELRSCAKAADQEMMSILLDVGADINSQPENGGPNAIDIALEAHAEKADFLFWLVQQGAVSNTYCQWRRNELFSVIKCWDLSAVQDLWQQGVNLNCLDDDGRTPLDILLADQHFQVPSGAQELNIMALGDNASKEDSTSKRRAFSDMAASKSSPRNSSKSSPRNSDDKNFVSRHSLSRHVNKIRHAATMEVMRQASALHSFIPGDRVMAFRYQWHMDQMGKSIRTVSKLLEAAIVLGTTNADGTHGHERLEVRFDFDHEIQIINISQVPSKKQGVDFLQWLTTHGAKAYHKTLHEEAIKGDLNRIRFLISLRILPDSVDEYQRTPLMIAARYGHLEICQHLLLALAGLENRDQLGSTAIHFSKTQPVAALLLHMRADVNACDDSGNTALHNVLDDKVCLTLLAARAEVNQSNSFGETPLHNAACHGRHQIIHEVLYAKASTTAVDCRGQTPLSVVQDVLSAKRLHEAGAVLSPEQIALLQQKCHERSMDLAVHPALRQQASKLSAWLASREQTQKVPSHDNDNLQSVSQKMAKKKYDPHWRKFTVSERANEILRDVENHKVWTPPGLPTHDEALDEMMSKVSEKSPRRK